MSYCYCDNSSRITLILVLSADRKSPPESYSFLLVSTVFMWSSCAAIYVAISCYSFVNQLAQTFYFHVCLCYHCYHTMLCPTREHAANQPKSVFVRFSNDTQPKRTSFEIHRIGAFSHWTDYSLQYADQLFVHYSTTIIYYSNKVGTLHNIASNLFSFTIPRCLQPCCGFGYFLQF